MIQSNFNKATADSDSGYGQLFKVLLRRKFWILGVLGIVLPIAAFNSLRKESTYQSSMQLLVESNYQPKDNIARARADTQFFADTTIEIDYATQLRLMRSTDLVQRAVDLLKPEYPDITVNEIRQYLAVSQVLETEDELETKIFQVDYTSHDPEKSQKVLEAMQVVYQDYNLEQQQARLKEGLAFINEQLPDVRRQLEQAEEELKQFRQNQNLINPDEQATAAAEALAAIEQERRAIGVEIQDTQARYASLQQQLERSPQSALIAARLSQSTRYQALLDALQQTELELTQRQVTFTDNEPMVQKLLEQRQRQQQLLAEEARRVLGNIPAQQLVTGEELFKEGQLGDTDLNLAVALVEAQTNLEALRARDLELAESEQRLRTELDRYPTLIAQYNRLQPEVEIKRQTLEQLLKARQDLGIEIARGGFKWQIVEAPLDGQRTGPNTKTDLMLATVVGLFLGGVAAFVREAMDDAVHTSNELKQQIALPLLGIIPETPHSEANGFLSLPFRKPQWRDSSILEKFNWLPFRESLDLVYKNIQLLNSTSEVPSLMVASALPGEGKSTLALGLALSAARLHQKVLLIDADLRRPVLHQQLNLPNEEGLSTVLAGETQYPHLQRICLWDSTIDVLTAGSTPSDPVKLLSSKQMKALMEKFEQEYDLVLLDTSPILGTVDAMQVASVCRGVIMVGRLDRITQSELNEATAMLSKLNVIGVVANGASNPMLRDVYHSEKNGRYAPREYQPLAYDQGSTRN